MPAHVVVLGAGFGGLEASARLDEELGEQVRVTLIDQNDSFLFGYSKLDVMYGARRLHEVELSYRDIARKHVDFRQERVVSIDPTAREVVTDKGEYRADALVVALGAELDPAATPGLLEGGHEFYSPAGAEGVAAVLPTFDSGTALISVLGPFFKCPPAPFEAAFLLHEFLERRGVRARTSIHVTSPLPSPIPASPETSAAITALLEAKGIDFWPSSLVERLDPEGRTAHLADGRQVAYDLFLGIPVHRAPEVVVDAGLTDDGWITVDPATFETRFPDVFAVGDITSAPVPRAGIIAEGEARTVADVIIARRTGAPAPPPYQGKAVCYIEMGPEGVGRVDVDFLSGPTPTTAYSPPSERVTAEKRAFGSSRRERWFGQAPV
jgi:sulfide:quinone oxidoreductase